MADLLKQSVDLLVLFLYLLLLPLIGLVQYSHGVLHILGVFSFYLENLFDLLIFFEEGLLVFEGGRASVFHFIFGGAVLFL